MPAATEAVFEGLEDTTAFEVLVFLLYREVHHGIDHVLELVGTSHLAGLVDLIDDHTYRASLLAEVGDVLEASNGRTSRDLTRRVLFVI